MNCTACETQLHDYVDGELADADTRAISAHLAACAACREKETALRTLLANAAGLAKERPPARDLWPTLAAQLTTETTSARSAAMSGSEPASATATPHPLARGLLTFLPWFATAAAVVFLAGVAARHASSHLHSPAWSVARLEGAPRVGMRAVSGSAPFQLGQWLETDATSRAKIAVGSVGEVTVDPNSRLRLAGVATGDHRLELARGSLRAFIWAPPRIFYVDTPSATAVDLGCAYTLTVDDRGDGELRVTSGYVALNHGARESIIPAGAACLTRRGAGPGTPFASDAPAELRLALERFDFEPGAASAALPTLLAQARREDAVTLWHLLSRTEGAAREEVFTTLARLTPPPEGVTRAGILSGDAAMRQAWGSALGFGSFFAVR